MSEHVRIQGDGISAEISPVGAELMSLRDSQGREWLWQGDPASWQRRAPMLFPFVGKLAGGVLRHQGRIYHHEAGHGFAPTSSFALARRDASGCTLTLAASESTRAFYPFEFRLSVSFRCDGGALVQVARVENVDTKPLAASVGFHPGFQWPLPSSPDAPRESHVVLFERAESAPIRRINASDGTIAPEAKPSPVQGRRLALQDGLFTTGALVFDRPASRSVWFGVEGRRGVSVAFPDCPHLGIWMRPPARYLCIEPWQGHGDPAGFAGDFHDKPGVVRLAPGEAFERRMSIAINAPQPSG
jgi:galactose mutarotase-like enzyme